MNEQDAEQTYFTGEYIKVHLFYFFVSILLISCEALRRLKILDISASLGITSFCIGFGMFIIACGFYCRYTRQ